MNDELLFLRPDVQVEPLVDQWYAWAHLIPPATAARNITERHIKIMESYIANPSLHANAVRDPRMAGGPFIDYKGERSDEISDLLRETKRKRFRLLQLSEAISALDTRLAERACGFSLEPLYKEIVPVELRGYVELVYDLHNNANIRFIESLLYRSSFYDRSAQSLMFSLTKGDDRPFALSTPRLEDDGILHLHEAFDAEWIDRFFRLGNTGQAWSGVRNLFGSLSEKEEHILRSLFTRTSPTRYEQYRGKGARWRYFGHACILVEAPGMTILFDPVISYTYETNIPRYTYRDLPDVIDYVVITHNHQDHILFETLLQIRHKVRTVIIPKGGSGSLQDPSLLLILRNVGFINVVELGEFETIETESGTITGLPFLGEHSDLNIQTKSAYLVELGRHKLIFAADSCNIEPRLYERIHTITGDVEVLFLGMECDGAPLSWLYGPLLTQKVPRDMDQSRRLSGSNFSQGLDLVNRFGCKEVYVYAMGQEPWLNHVMNIKYTDESRPIVESNRLLNACHSQGICAERLFGEKEILLDA